MATSVGLSDTDSANASTADSEPERLVVTERTVAQRRTRRESRNLQSDTKYTMAVSGSEESLAERSTVAPEPEPEPESAAQSQPAQLQLRTVWLPASLMETRPLATTSRGSRPRQRVVQTVRAVSPATCRKQQFKHNPDRSPRNQSRRTPERSRRHIPTPQGASAYGCSPHSPDRSPRHSPMRPTSVRALLSKRSPGRSPRLSATGKITSTSSSPGPLITDNHTPSAIIGNGNPLNEQKMFSSAGDLAWAASLRSSSATCRQVLHSMNNTISLNSSSSSLQKCRKDRSHSIRSRASETSDLASSQSLLDQSQSESQCNSGDKTTKQAGKGRSAIIFDGTTPVHANMFANAAGHTWASSLRDSGSPTNSCSASRNKSESNRVWSNAFACPADGAAIRSRGNYWSGDVACVQGHKCDCPSDASGRVERVAPAQTRRRRELAPTAGERQRQQQNH